MAWARPCHHHVRADLDKHSQEGNSVLGPLVAVGDGQATHGCACGFREQREQGGGNARPAQQGCKQGGRPRVLVYRPQLRAQPIHDVVCVGCRQALSFRDGQSVQAAG